MGLHRMDGLPTLPELGMDLLDTNPWQRAQPLLMPYFWSIAFMAAWQVGLYWLSFLSLVMVFSASSTSTHDVVHGSLGLNRQWTERLLFLLGAPVLESGHAYRLTHIEHHRTFPSHDDLEGQAAMLPVWRVLLEGPAFLFRLWIWAWRKTSKMPVQRRWLILELLLPMVGLVIGWLSRPVTDAPLAYVVCVLISSWFYPLFAVHLPHRHYGETRVSHAWTLRGLIIPRLFLPLAFHLEHHLYPKVPSHNLPKLAKRLEPWLIQHQVRVLHVP